MERENEHLSVWYCVFSLLMRACAAVCVLASLQVRGRCALGRAAVFDHTVSASASNATDAVGAALLTLPQGFHASLD